MPCRRNSFFKQVTKVLFIGALALGISASAGAQSFGRPSGGANFYQGNAQPKIDNQGDDVLLGQIDWTQRLNQQIPLNAQFRDENGKKVELKKYFGKKPVLLEMVYFYCPMLCIEVMKGTFRGLEDVSFKAGKDYEMVVISISPTEGPELAKREKAKYLKEFNKESEANGIHFLTGEKTEIDKVADAVGFSYALDEATGQYAHPAGLVLATHKGIISRYLGGVNFNPKDLRLGLLETSDGKIGSPIDMIVLKCHVYDGTTGKYTLAITNGLRVGAAAILMAIALTMIILVRNDVNRSKKEQVEEVDKFSDDDLFN